MISPSGSFRIYLASEPVDFRKGMDGLVAHVAIRGAPVITVSLGYPDEVPEAGEAELLLRGLIFPGA